MYCGRAWKNCFQVSAYVLVRVAHVQRISRLNWVDRMNGRSEFPHVLIQSINIYQITFSLSVICLNVVKMRCVALLNEFLTSSDASARLASSRNGKKIGWQRVWVPGLRRATFFLLNHLGPEKCTHNAVYCRIVSARCTVLCCYFFILSGWWESCHQAGPMSAWIQNISRKSYNKFSPPLCWLQNNNERDLELWIMRGVVLKVLGKSIVRINKDRLNHLIMSW